jgi:hypothetical protein
MRENFAMNGLFRKRVLSAAVGIASGMKVLAAARAETSAQPSASPGVGGSDPGSRDRARDAENPDILNPPPTDHGTLPNLRFSFQSMDGADTARVGARTPEPRRRGHGSASKAEIPDRAGLNHQPMQRFIAPRSAS